MTDKEFEKFLKDYNNIPTSGFISKTNSKGEKEWSHYRFHDTSWTDGPIGGVIVVIVLFVGTIGWMLGY